jgi:hypothetical protein
VIINESEMAKKLQRKRLPRKKSDTDTELCRKNGQNTFTLFKINAENVLDA